jgi:hypothetical protein
MSIQDGSVGQFNFVERYGLWSDEQFAATGRIESDIKQHNLRTIGIYGAINTVLFAARMSWRTTFF